MFEKSCGKRNIKSKVPVALWRGGRHPVMRPGVGRRALQGVCNIFFFLKETKAREKAKWNSIELEGGYIVIVHLLVYLKQFMIKTKS